MEEEQKANYRHLAFIVGMGILASTFAQTGMIGLYPFRFLLKDQLGEGAVRVALFTQLVNIPWNIKIISGIISDTLPIRNSRRKMYLIIASFLAGLCWLGVAFVPHAYNSLLIMAFIMNIALVFVSTVSGGLLVEGGQTYKATGRLSALRVFAMNIAGLAVPIGAFIATKSLIWTALCAAFPLFLTGFLAMRYKEKPVQRDPKIWMDIKRQLRVALTSKMLWVAAGLLFLVQFAPGFMTPLMFYQTDVLHFDENAIGKITLLSTFSGAAGAFFYAFFCRRFSLRVMIYGSIAFTALLTLVYLGYNDFQSALIIDVSFAFFYNLAQLPLFDIAARATPKGSEALGYAVIMSVWNWGLFFSDLIGSALYEKYGLTFKQLVWVNAGTTALVLLVVPFLPKLLVDSKEGDLH